MALALAPRPGGPARSDRLDRVGAALGVPDRPRLSHEAPPIPGARAATDGAVVWSPPSGTGALDDLLLAHELAHVAAARSGGPSDPARAELEADVAAAEASLRLSGQAVPAPARRLRARPLALAACGPSPAERLARGETLSASDARSVLDRFAAMDPSAREAFVAQHCASVGGGDGVRRLIESIPVAERSGAYREPIAALLHIVQRLAAERDTGMSVTEMATAQHTTWAGAVERDAQAEAAARGLAAPTPADREVAGQQQVEQRSLGDRAVNRWDAMAALPGVQAAWNTRARAVADEVVALWNRRNPDTPITNDVLVLDPGGIEARGAGVVAFADGGRIHVGLDWIAGTDPTVIRNGVAGDPANGLANIAHEVFGHPDYGDELAWEIIRPAAAGVPGVDLSTTEGQKDVYDGFAYFETEIYAELREFDHLTAGNIGDEPEADIRLRLGNLRSGWDHTVARGLLVGLNERLRLDPRISDAARALYVRLVNEAWGSEVVR
jgi:hypothetical protein